MIIIKILIEIIKKLLHFYFKFGIREHFNVFTNYLFKIWKIIILITLINFHCFIKDSFSHFNYMLFIVNVLYYGVHIVKNI